MQWNIPNVLTLMRLIAAPGVAIMFLYFTRPYADWFALALFVLAAITDFFDGYLARLWKQESRFGAMLDPIADKAMVVIALTVITGLSTAANDVMDPWILLPATAILFREVFVSGLREFLGDTAGTLKVTKLAKYKTTFQMVAIAVLFTKGVFEHYFVVLSIGMDHQIIIDILEGREEDIFHLRWYWWGLTYVWWIGVAFLWMAAVLTLITGADYFAKAWPFIKDTKDDKDGD